MRPLFFLLLLTASVFSARFEVDNATVCPCQFGALHVTTTNIQDTPFTTVLSAQSNLSVFPKTAELRAPANGQTVTVFQTAAACDAAPGDYPVRFEPAGITATVHVNACTGFALSVTPYQGTCQNQHADYAVRVQNLGANPRTVFLGTDLAPGTYVLGQSVFLNASETKTVILSINTNAVPQRLPFKVVARSDDAYQEQPALLDIAACQGIRFLSGTNFTLLEGASGAFTVRLQNLGKSRTVNLRAFCPPFVTPNATTLQLNGSGIADIGFAATNAPLGDYSCTVFAEPADEGKSYTHTFAIHVTPTTPHLSVQPTAIELENGVTQSVAFTLTNTGTPINGSVTFTSTRTQQFEPVPAITLGQEQKTATLTLSGTSNGNATGQLHVGTILVPLNVTVLASTLLFNATVYTVPQGLRVDYTIQNNGPGTLVRLSSRPQTSGPADAFVAANDSATLTLIVPDANATTLFLQLATDRGTYENTVDLTQPQPAPQTGLVSFATPVIAFAAAILLALILLYFLYRESQAGKATATKQSPTNGQKKLTTY